MLSVDPGATFPATVSAATGLTGTLAVQIVAPGSIVFARTTTGVAEFPAGSGAYGATLTAPLPPGVYLIVWDWAGSGAVTPSNSHVDQFAVNFERPEIYGEDCYRLDYFDPGALVSDGTPNSNPIPLAADVRQNSSLPWTDYGAGLARDSGPGGLQEVVDRAESAFFSITGQTLSSIDIKWAPQVRRVVQGMSETIAMQSAEDTLSTTSDWDLISSFSAGPYTESHRSPKDMLDGRMLWPVPWVSMALWGMLTPERYGFWMAFFTGIHQPAWAATDVFWSEGQILGEMYGPWLGGLWGA